MKIRPFEDKDQAAIEEIHANSDLPGACMPDTSNPLFIIKQVVELQNQVALAAFVKIVSEAFLLVDHSVGTPAERWHALKCLAETMEVSAKLKGLEECTVWVPKELAESSFGSRLEDLGFIATDFKSYTKVIK
jgi:hypothetical protein